MKNYVPELTISGIGFVNSLTVAVMVQIAKRHNVSYDVVFHTVNAKCNNQIAHDFEKSMLAHIETALHHPNNRYYFNIRTWSKYNVR